ncbi:MAG: T9SS type A sorting domain-containing protein [Bacteroidetes bacterium]|nr:T9SS type A sorting domain-containing protein [Bacteroidota bacterium]
MKKILFIILSALYFLEVYAQAPDSWTQKASFSGTARWSAAGFSINGKGYIGTGGNNSSLYKDFWEYNPVTDVWTQKADFGGTARWGAVGFSINGKGYLGTGDGSSGHTKDFWEYDPSTNLWTQKADYGGAEHNNATGFSINGKGYIGTGYNNIGYTRDFWEYDPTINLWTKKADFGGTARWCAVGFSINGKGYIGTGLDGNSKKDFWEYDPTTNLWAQKADFGGTARYFAAGLVISNKGYIGTGLDGGGYRKDFWKYDPTTNFWSQSSDINGAARRGAVALNINGQGYLGIGDANGAISDFWKYNDSVFTPTIPSFTPDNGYTGSSITITGTGFTGATAVTFGGTNVASFTVNDDSHITAIVGVGITGTVSVTTPGGTTSSATSFTYNGYVTATSDGSWDVGTTWLGGNVPPDDADKTLNHVVNIHSHVTNSGAITANTYFNIYSTFTNNGSTTINGSLQMGDGGVFVNNGTITYGSNGILGYYNTVARTTGDEFPAVNGPNILIASNLGGVTLHASRAVNYLQVNAGKLTLGNNNITAIAINYSTPTHYIVTNGTGTLTLKNVSSSPKLFPVGPSATSYNPITISNGGDDDFSVKVQSAFTNALNDSSKAVNAQWTISKTGAQTGNNVTLTPQWNASDEAGYPTSTFYRNGSIVLGHYGGSSWNEIPASSVSGSGPYTTTVTGINSFSPFGVGNVRAFAVAAYVTATDGDWSTGSTWVGGNVPPDGSSVIINHTVTMDISPTINSSDSMIVNGKLVTGYNTVSGSGKVVVNGVVKTINGAGFSGASNASFSNTLSSLTLNSSSTVEYAGFGSTVITPINYANLTSSGAGGRILPSNATIGISGVFTPGSNAWTTLGASSTVEFNSTGPQNIPAIPYDNLSLSNIGVKSFSYSSDPTEVGGDLIIGAGTTVDVWGNIHLEGNWINNGYTSFASNGFIQFVGVAPQTIGGTYPTYFNSLFVSNAAGIYLNKDIRFGSGGSLIFGADGTKIHTGVNRIVFENSAINTMVNNPTTYIHGNVEMWLSSSDNFTTKYFKIGDATTYCPVTIDLQEVISSQNIDVSPSEPGDHPNISTSTLDANKSVNRYWKIASDNNISFAGTYDVTFEFSPADVDAGANPANFKVGIFTQGAWTYPTTVYIDATHIKATGVSSLGDFVIAEMRCIKPSIITQPIVAQTICANSVPADLTLTATGDGLSFQWYSNSVNSISGGTTLSPMGTNSSYTPSATTSGTFFYYCIVTGPCDTAISSISEVIVTPGQTYYQDADGDSYGNPNVSIQSCTQPQGYVTNNTDCDDTDPNVYPEYPSVNITGDFLPSQGICAGVLTTFTATSFYGGNSPLYQWKKNNINVGTNSNKYSDSTLTDTDVITCELTSNAVCAVNATALSNSIIVLVHPLPLVNAGYYPTYTTNDPPFSLNGSPVGGLFSGIGVTGTGNMFDPSIAGLGDHTISYYYADGNSGCGNSATTIIHIINNSGCTEAPMIGNIAGTNTACGIAGTASSATYSVDNIEGTTYTWTKSSSLIQIIDGQNTNSINATFSSNFSSGTITVTATNACGSTVKIISITKNKPSTPGAITGATNACASVNIPIAYTIKKVAGATSYIWSTPNGVSILGGVSPFTTSDTSINVIYSPLFITGVISVSAVNDCGISAVRYLTVANKVPATPGNISGPIDVCEYIGGNVNYTINSVANATSYDWQIPDGVNIISTNVNDTSIVLNFADTFTTGIIKVKAKSGCGDGLYRSLTVSKKLPGTPGVITGPTDVCEFIGGNATYTINSVANATTYKWQIPDGVNIISGNVNDTSIVLNFTEAFTSGVIKVNASRACGDGPSRSLTVSKKLPGTPGVITASGDICSSMYIGANTTVTYTIPANATGPFPTSYVWTLVPIVPGSAEIVSGSGVIGSIPNLTVETTGLSIQIQFHGNYTGGTLSVVAKRSCGTSGQRKLTLTKNVPPTPTISVVTGTICTGAPSSVYYTASGQPNTDYYIWSTPSGTKIEGSETKSPTRDTTTYNTIVVDYPANFISGNITVKGKSVCGTSAVATLAVSSQSCSMPGNIIQNKVESQQAQTSVFLKGQTKALIYPNPNNGDFMLKIESDNRTDNALIEITDIMGRPMRSYTISNNNGSMLLHVTDISFANGTYILKYKIGNEIKVKNFIVEK